MRPLERQTRSHLMSLFEQRGIHPRHKLGQNFLIDLNLLDFIVDQAEPGPGDVVLEIGTGTGSMTALLAGSAGDVVSVEIDPHVQELAREATAHFANVTLLLTDALRNKNHLADVVLAEIDGKLAQSPDRRLKLVANLPYAVATPVISNLVASERPWSLMIVTIQWELAQRMQAAPGTDDYSALSVWLQSQCDIKVLKKLGPQVFWPRPGVDSAIVRLEPAPERREQIGDRSHFHEFIRRLFSQRRKSLRSVLSGMYRGPDDKQAIGAALASLGIPDGTRAEQLDAATLVKLAGEFRRSKPE